MEDLFEAEFFIGNRRRLKTLFQGKAPIVLTANGLLQHAGDSTYPFKQDSNFWYLTGVNEPDVVLVMDKNKEYLIVPSREGVRKAFDGDIDIIKLASVSGIAEVVDEATGWKRLQSRLKKVKSLATVSAPPVYAEVFGFYTNPARTTLINKLRDINPGAEMLDLRQHLAVMRMTKQPPELAAIKSAIKITGDTIKEVHHKIAKFGNEYEIEASLTYGFRRRGSSGHAFTPIVAAGANASVIHYIDNNSEILLKDLVLLDVGAEVSNYAADISRTFSRVEPTKRQRAVYEVVRDVQDYAFGLLGPGVLMREYEQKVEYYMGEKLRELGLIKVIEKEKVRQYYPHSVSHFLGLDVHDAGDYERPLEPGTVLTVEPGIYIPEEGLGVRIEDDVLVTESGITILTEKINRDL